MENLTPKKVNKKELLNIIKTLNIGELRQNISLSNNKFLTNQLTKELNKRIQIVKIGGNK